LILFRDSTNLRLLKRLLGAGTLVVELFALAAACGEQRQSLPPVKRSVALREARATADDWVAEHLKEASGVYLFNLPPKCRRRTPSSFRCTVQTYDSTPKNKYAYLEMAVAMGTPKSVIDADTYTVDGRRVRYLLYGKVTKVVQQRSRLGKPVLWLPSGTEAPPHTEAVVRHFGDCPEDLGDPPESTFISGLCP